MNKYFLVNSLFVLLFVNGIYAQNKVNGTVFNDRNGNGKQDTGESGLPGILVSNGKELVATDSNGAWELKVESEYAVFVVKPAGYAVPLNENNLPLYYHVNNSKTTNNEYPHSINFPLIPQKENNKFSVVFFGDTQARGFKEVDYIFHDVVEELIGTDAALGISLGDNVADDPNLMDDISRGISAIGIPWYNSFGNHDSDRDAEENKKRDNTFEKLFGPSTYAFEYADVAFIGLNNIYFKPTGSYQPHFTDDQLSFVENYLQHVPDDKLIVLYMHAPIVACDNRESMYKIIEKRKHSFSISGHLHEQVNLFLNKEMGWNGAKEHHHLINATVCGSWWCGALDELNIPHATMNDGGPNGYSVVTFSGNDYSVHFKAARKPDNYQMNIYLPNEIEVSVLDTTKVLVNVFAGSERSKVEMQIDKVGEWIPLEMVKTIDPECLRMHKLSPVLKEKVKGQALDDLFGYTMDYPGVSHHMWETALPENMVKGTHLVTIRTTDMYNTTWESHRIFRVIEANNKENE